MHPDEAGDIVIASGNPRWRAAAGGSVDRVSQFREALDREFRFVERLKEASCDTCIQRCECTAKTVCQRGITRQEMVLPNGVRLGGATRDDGQVISEVRPNQYSCQVIGDGFQVIRG